MRLPEFSVGKPVMTLMIFFAVLLLGVVSLVQTPIDILPEIDVPTIGIITMYEGASPEDIEKLVTKVIESRVATISHVKNVTSRSEENLSSIILQFDWGTNLDEAANDVRQAVDFAKQLLPEDSEDPMLFKFDLSMMPIIYMGLSAEESYDQLNELAEKRLCDPIERLPGVAIAEPIGGKIREIKVIIDRKRLSSYHISESDISRVLALENVSSPAGKIKMGRNDYILRIPGEYSSPEEIRNTVVGAFDGTPVYMKDVARIVDGFKEKENRVRLDGKPSVLVIVQKQSDQNTVEVANNVRNLLTELEPKFPEDVEIKIIMDTSDFIKDSIYNLGTTVIWAIFFVVAIVFLFLREWRGSLIVGMTIPFSLILSIIFIYLADYTINTMSLSAIAIAIGMVVDNAIVIFENIHFHRREIGEAASESAIFGSSEVGLAVVASTATTVSIFLPVIFVPGITGIIFKELAITIIIVLLGSLFCALTLTPMLSSQLFASISSEKGVLGSFREKGDRFFERLIDRYHRILAWALQHRKTVILAGVGIFVISILLMSTVGTEFFPQADQGEVRGTVELEVGTRVEVTDTVMARIEKILQNQVPELDIMFASCGPSESGWSAMMGETEDTHIISVGGMLVSKDERRRSDAEIGRLLSREVSKIPGVVNVDFTPQDQFSVMMSGGEKPISIEIYGQNLDKSFAFAQLLKSNLEDVEGLIDASISRKPGKPELWIKIDREKASLLGLSTNHISSTVRTHFAGQTSSLYREGGEEYDINVRLKEEQRRDIKDVFNTPIVSPVTGKQIPLKNVATIEYHRGPLVFERKNQERIIYLRAGIFGRPLGNVVNDIRNKMDNITIPDDIAVRIGGTAEDQASSFKYLFMALLLGIVLVYMVMASQFESFIDPFVIMFSVPFAITGVVMALLITGNTLNMVSYVGMIMLVGIVVNNAIVLVDFTNILRARGLGIREAILSAGRRRLRPVLMTTVTTALALTPLAIRGGEGSETWRPLAIAVIGGLLVSSAITLIFVPTLYSIIEEKLKGKRAFKKIWGGEQ
jgi:HAE1 family hydrophobic/amphiphilic exporter-1